MNLISENPKIYTIDNILTDEECQHFINLSKDKFGRALVTTDDGSVVSKQRSGQNYWMCHDHDEIVFKVAKKISELVNYPLENAEKFQIIYYSKTQEYHSHYDGWLFNKSETTTRCLLQGGQRMITALVYLNDVESGGETRFSNLNISVSPKKGRILVFHNCHEGTNIINPMSEHAGTPVKKGEKYAFNLWFRQQPINTPYIHSYE